MDAHAIEKLTCHQSGLLSVSSDMRVLLDSDEPRAQLAIELFCYRIGRELGSLAAALGGLDAIVFTAGIGERAAAVREKVGRAANCCARHERAQHSIAYGCARAFHALGAAQDSRYSKARILRGPG